MLEVLSNFSYTHVKFIRFVYNEMEAHMNNAYAEFIDLLSSLNNSLVG
jgi:hypothetical protein